MGRDVGLFCISLIGFFLCLLLLYLFISEYKLRVLKDTYKVSKLVLIYGLSGLISFIFACLFYSILFISKFDSYNADEILTINAILWNCGHIFCYLLFFNRYYYSFMSTPFKTSKNIYNILLTLIIFYIIAVLLLIPYMFTKNTSLLLVYSIFIEILNWIITLTLLALFIRKFLNVTLFLSREQFMYDEMDDNNDDEFDEIKNNDDTSELYAKTEQETGIVFSEQQNNLFNLISKVFILTIIAIISTQILLIHMLIFDIKDVILNGFADESEVNIKGNLIFHYISRILDSIVMSFCLFLNFKFTDKYYGILCKSCHNSLKKYYIKKTTNILLNSNQNYKLMTNESMDNTQK